MSTHAAPIPSIKGVFRHSLAPPGRAAARQAGDRSEWYINDHSFVVCGDTLHWFGVTNPYPVGGNYYGPGSHLHVGHASAKDPFGLWTEHPDAFSFAPGSSHFLGAGFVTANGAGFTMLCDTNLRGRGLHTAVSADLFNWDWDGSVDLVSAGPGTRDPCIIPDPRGGYLLYVTGGKAEEGVISLASSPDLRAWTWEPPALTPDASVKPGALESPFVHRRGAWYYLFVNFSHHQYEETRVFASRDPRRFDWHASVCTLFAHAAEVFEFGGRTYISHCGLEDRHWADNDSPFGLYLAELQWLEPVLE